jgi:hypothetical protein
VVILLKNKVVGENQGETDPFHFVIGETVVKLVL